MAADGMSGLEKVRHGEGGAVPRAIGIPSCQSQTAHRLGVEF